MEPQLRILGPFEVAAQGQLLELGGPKPRRLLAVLVLAAGDVVSVDRLVEAVWEHDPPPGAEATLRTHVANLRRRLFAAELGDRLVTRPPGYLFHVPRTQVDAFRFEQLVTGGRAALDRGDAEDAGQSLRQALGLWRGRVLEDLDCPAFAEAEAARLEGVRLVALEARIDADLALGRHQELVAELEVLVDAHAFRERLWGRLMLALYRSGRQADALEAYRVMQQRLDEELGLSPGQELSELETAILNHDPSLAPASGAPASGPAGAASESARDAVPSRSGAQPAFDALFDVVRRVPMVGRADELAHLRQRWQVVRDGGRRLVLVSGEAGVGKSRLVAELAAAATDAGAALLVGRCEQAALIPYQPVTDALAASPAAAAALAGAPAPLRQRLVGLMDRAAGSQTAPVSPEDPEGQRVAFLDAVGELFARMASVAPVVFVVEDAEAIDRASARLLCHLARHLPERVLLLTCFRDPPGSRHPPLRELLADLEGRGLADRLALDPLPERDLGQLVATWIGAPASAAFVHTLWSSTSGNPFYASEVVRELADRGGVDHADDAWQVPRGVRDVLRERLRALSATAQDVIGCAAVLGLEFHFALLVQIAEQAEDHVAEALGEAVDAGWSSCDPSCQ